MGKRGGSAPAAATSFGSRDRDSRPGTKPNYWKTNWDGSEAKPQNARELVLQRAHKTGWKLVQDGVALGTKLDVYEKGNTQLRIGHRGRLKSIADIDILHRDARGGAFQFSEMVALYSKNKRAEAFKALKRWG